MDMAAVRTQVAASVTDVTERPIQMLVDEHAVEASSMAATALFDVVYATDSDVLRCSSRRTIGVWWTLVQMEPSRNQATGMEKLSCRSF